LSQGPTELNAVIKQPHISSEIRTNYQ